MIDNLLDTIPEALVWGGVAAVLGVVWLIATFRVKVRRYRMSNGGGRHGMNVHAASLLRARINRGLVGEYRRRFRAGAFDGGGRGTAAGARRRPSRSSRMLLAALVAFALAALAYMLRG